MPYVLALLMAAALAQPLALHRPPPIRLGLAAFPRIARPADDSQRRINLALDRLDAHALAAARECLRDAGKRGGGLNRQVTATFAGPEFLSFTVVDDVDCGGAHPDTGHSAIVYDVRLGLPVVWTALLSARVAGTLALTQGEDGVKVVTLASPRLWALYRAGYDHGAPDPAENKECRNAIDEAGADGPPPMLAWLEEKEGGLALQFDLGHAEEACSEPGGDPCRGAWTRGGVPALARSAQVRGKASVTVSRQSAGGSQPFATGA